MEEGAQNLTWNKITRKVSKCMVFFFEKITHGQNSEGWKTFPPLLWDFLKTCSRNWFRRQKNINFDTSKFYPTLNVELILAHPSSSHFPLYFVKKITWKLNSKSRQIYFWTLYSKFRSELNFVPSSSLPPHFTSEYEHFFKNKFDASKNPQRPSSRFLAT